MFRQLTSQRVHLGSTTLTTLLALFAGLTLLAGMGSAAVQAADPTPTGVPPAGSGAMATAVRETTGEIMKRQQGQQPVGTPIEAPNPGRLPYDKQPNPDAPPVASWPPEQSGLYTATLVVLFGGALAGIVLVLLLRRTP